MFFCIRNAMGNQALLSLKMWVLVTLCIPSGLMAQKDFFQPSPDYNPTRVRGVVIAETVGGAVITLGLNYLWYKKFPHSRFHLFNDNKEWLNMDKMGHATTAYNILAGQSVTSNLTGQDLGGLTLTPGVYFFSSSAQLTGTLTLDFLSNPNALFVFQIGSTLTTASGSSVNVVK